MYTRITRRSRVYLVIYVDDMLICGDCDSEIEEVKLKLSNEFKMKDLGPVKTFMGINIEYDEENGVLTLDQEQYINQLLSRFGMSDCNPLMTPMEANL